MKYANEKIENEFWFIQHLYDNYVATMVSTPTAAGISVCNPKDKEVIEKGITIARGRCRKSMHTGIVEIPIMHPKTPIRVKKQLLEIALRQQICITNRSRKMIENNDN